MNAEEIRNVARMARTMLAMVATMVERLEQVAEDVAHMERTATPAATQTIGALPPGVMDLRDPSIWGRIQ
jgi:hypothetical protein